MNNKNSIIFLSKIIDKQKKLESQIFKKVKQKLLFIKIIQDEVENEKLKIKSLFKEQKENFFNRIDTNDYDFLLSNFDKHFVSKKTSMKEETKKLKSLESNLKNLTKKRKIIEKIKEKKYSKWKALVNKREKAEWDDTCQRI